MRHETALVSGARLFLSLAMIVPQFWAEARRHQPRAAGRPQVTVRRFGWSDSTQAEADAMAEQRAQAAFLEVIAGKKIDRRERKVAYNGAHGVPIREEVLERHGDVVITRNAYGARCLNTPDVLFADVDFSSDVRVWVSACTIGALFAATLYVGFRLDSKKVGFGLMLVALFSGHPLAASVRKLWVTLRGGAERVARRKVEAFARAHPEWGLRLYRTPAGFRVLVLHALFAPDDPAVTACFSALGVDPVYAAMCRNQRCFRARVSPKPWRIGIGKHLRPRPGVWPMKPEHLEMRRTWVRDYETASTNFAACRFVETIGAQTAHPKADAVRDLHDRLAQALSGREIA